MDAALKPFLPDYDMRRDASIGRPVEPEPMAEASDDVQTPEGRRFALAMAHAYRLMAMAHAAKAEAELANPWAPESYRKSSADSERTAASYAMDQALQFEAEAAE